MSKSNAAEIIALLYAILSRLVHTSWIQWVFIGFSIFNVLESIYYSYHEHKEATQ